MSKPSFFAELKRRNVLRAGALYIGAAWALSQGVAQLLPVFDIPNWVVRWFVIAAMVGFPFAMLFSWFYEWTPQGIQRESEVEQDESVARQTGKTMDRWIIAALGVAVVLLLTNQFVLRRDANAAAASTPATSIRAQPISAKSIAVLPFENLSADRDNAYFAGGIQDEILTGLAKIGDLKVISRTSTKRYASRPDNIAEIGKQLGVAHILEGSVQKVGNRVRVNVQLIDAASDSHLWAETYDRNLDDVFAVQSEVAQKIAGSLQARLTSDERKTLATRPTANPKAYAAYLRGLAFDALGDDDVADPKAAEAYAEAVRLDPGFALAWAALAIDSSNLHYDGIEPATYTADYVKQAADTAIRLQPDLSEAQLAQGFYLYYTLRDYPAALQAFESMLRSSPNDPRALRGLGFSERRLGQWEPAMRHLQQAADRDPRNPVLLTSLGQGLMYLRRYDEAHRWLDRALAVTPGFRAAIMDKVESYQGEGRLQDAARLLESVPQTGEDPFTAWDRSQQRLLEHRYDAAIAESQPLLAQTDADSGGFGVQALSLNLALAQRFSGNDAQARAIFERVVSQIERQPGGTWASEFMLAQAYAGLGKNQLALEHALHAVATNRDDALNLANAEQTLAQVQAMTGDRTAAIATLAQSWQMPGGISLGDLRFDPIWEPLRKDPRFQKLIADAEAAQARIQTRQ